MGLEVGTYISDLVTTNPVGATDPKNQGDDHIRLIKTVLKNTFPNINGAISLTDENINNAALKDSSNTFATATTQTLAGTSILRIETTSDVTLASTGHGLQLGLSGGLNLAVDNDEIQARNNGAASTLGLNVLGGAVIIGDASSSVSIPGTLAPGGLILSSTDAGATSGPLIDLYRDSASPAANDLLGNIAFNGENSIGTKTNFANLTGLLLDPTVGTEDGAIRLSSLVAGAAVLLDLVPLTGGGLSIRPNGASGEAFSISSTGDVTVNGSVTAVTEFISTGVNANLNTGSAGTIRLRPNGVGATSGELALFQTGNVTIDGNLTLAGDIHAVQDFVSTTANAVFATTGAGTIFFRPNGEASTLNQVTISAAGNLTAGVNTSGVFFDNHFFLSDNDTGLDYAVSGEFRMLSNGAEVARLTATGINVGNTAADPANVGSSIQADGNFISCTVGQQVAIFNRTGSDGVIVSLRGQSVEEGSISVSGGTVSYNTFMASHWSQLADNSRPDILQGTIVESINKMCKWPKENNDRLPCFKISDKAESPAVYGIFHTWDNDDDRTNDAYIASIGAGWVRIRKDEKIKIGDLIDSAGDGTGKVQSDNIFRASTVAKITSLKVVETYPDGSFRVPATLHCG